MRQWLDALPPTVVAQSPNLNIWYGWVLALQNEFEAMQPYLGQAQKQAQRLGRTQKCWRSEARMVRGKIAAIRTHAAVIRKPGCADAVLDAADTCVIAGPISARARVAWLSRARAFEHLKRFDEADHAYMQAQRTTQRAEHPFLYLGVLETHARFLVQREERERARDVLKRAIAFARANHVEALAASIKTLLEEIAPPSPKPNVPDPLSAQEREILRWLARGESNPQIAKRLGIGVGTVNWHTKNIYKKLGVRNRTEAAVVARTM